MLWDHEMLSCFQLEHCTKFRKGTKSGMHLYALILPVWRIQSPLSQLMLLNKYLTHVTWRCPKWLSTVASKTFWRWFVIRKKIHKMHGWVIYISKYAYIGGERIHLRYLYRLIWQYLSATKNSGVPRFHRPCSAAGIKASWASKISASSNQKSRWAEWSCGSWATVLRGSFRRCQI